MRTPITQKGYDKLIEEFNYLNQIQLPKINKVKSIAAANGDRSENGDYIAAKEVIRHISRRIKYLQKMINNIDIVNVDFNVNPNKVMFSTKVTVENINSGEILSFIIAGDYETEVESNIVSIDAPISKNAIGKSIGDEYVLNISNNEVEYEIQKIEFVDIWKEKKVVKYGSDFEIK